MKLTPLEKETIISFNEEEQTASIYTYNPKLKRRLKELCSKRPAEVIPKRTEDMAIEYVIPKYWIKINPPREVSEEQKEQMKQRAAHARDSLKSNI